MRAALLLALWPSVAGSQHIQYAWGSALEEFGPSALVLESCSSPCVAVVRFDNTLVTLGTAARSGTPAFVRAVIATNEIEIVVTVETGIGMAPDLMRITLPTGYIAQPTELLVSDNSSGQMRVVKIPTS